MTKVVLEGKTWYLIPEAEYEVIRQQMREDCSRQLNRRDIAKLLGISVNRLSECPWLLPYFGQGMKRKRNATWSEREVMNWNKRSPQELKEAYLNGTGA